MKQRILLIVAIIIGIYFTFSLSRQVWHLWQAKERLELAKTEVVKVEAENQKLKSSSEYKQSSDYVESEARNKLNFAKEGEKIVNLSQSLEEVKKSEEEQKLANWQKWQRLLFEF